MGIREVEQHCDTARMRPEKREHRHGLCLPYAADTVGARGGIPAGSDGFGWRDKYPSSFFLWACCGRVLPPAAAVDISVVAVCDELEIIV
ncbi:hypothetical protein BHE74_00045390 [Ensete ventricosum]|nr:hypothetical protein BHE74_00045390 [Ensete ventricosum]RZS13851.1 hypothetical protein BHM03_00045475 [Ensete ventricosum]